MDLTGRLIGNLTVLGQATNRGRARYWMCRCACGAFVEARATRLIRAVTISCGCLGYRRDSERHRIARLKVAPKRRVAIARLGRQAQYARNTSSNN